MIRTHHIYSLLAAAVACILLTGCIRELCPRQAVGNTDQAEVLLKISTRQTKADTDYYGIRSIRIYAYRHGATNQPAVGYAYFPDIDREGPYYCPIQIGDGSGDISFPAEIDFIVLLNDDSASPAPDLDETSTLSELDSKVFSTISDNSGTAYVPMCNERVANGSIDQNNFSFTVNGTPGQTQVIPIDVKRCVSWLTLNLTKEGESEITVNSVTLRKGPEDAPLTLSSNVINDTGNYFAASDADASVELLPSGSSVKLVTGDPDTTEGSLVAETFLLPNPYGSGNPDLYEQEENSSYNDVNNTYRLDINYTIKRNGTGAGATRQKTVYLPSVPANSHIKVTGTIKDAIHTDVTLNVIVNSWTVHEINVPAFE